MIKPIKPRLELLTAADYSKVIYPHLPPEAFRPCPERLFRIGVHIVTLVCALILIKVSPWWFIPLLAPVVGHTLACMGLLGHDVSHCSIVTNRFFVRSLEMILFGLNVVPPMIWRRIHNQSHHPETNTVKDPDRKFYEDEQSVATITYVHLFHPGGFRILPKLMVFAHFIPYILRNIAASLLPGDLKPEIVPFKPTYSLKQKITIVLELIWIVLLQSNIYLFEGDLWRYLWAGPVAWLFTSAVIKGYIFTNHFLNPQCEHTDPLVGSTSVIVPKVWDWFHNNVSYHTEHHIYPRMNSKYYPLVTKLLQEHFADRFQRVSIFTAWSKLFELDAWHYR